MLLCSGKLCFSVRSRFISDGFVRLRLRDRDDDVRSAAAATLSPIADALVSSLPAELQQVVDVLWECLGDLKDDLSSSVGGVMDLLGKFSSGMKLVDRLLNRLPFAAKLLAFPSVLALMQSPTMGWVPAAFKRRNLG